MNAITQHYIIDLSSNNNFVQVPAVQGDGNNTRYIEIELIENGTRYVVDTANCDITIAGTKPDGKEVWNPCRTQNGFIMVEITYQMTACPGRGNYQIMIFKKGTNNQLKSFPFILLVTPATFDPSYIESADEFQILVNYTHGAKDAAEAAKKSAEDAALAGSIGIMHVDRETGHLIFEKVDPWRGSFEIRDHSHLYVTWE